jgi:hypothetical protein
LLCAEGTPSIVTLVNNNTWTWTCSSGGNESDCSTLKDCSWTEVNP